MELTNVKFVSINIDNLSFGYLIGETSKGDHLNKSNTIQPFKNFNYLLTETNKRSPEAIFQLGMCYEFGSLFYNTDNSQQLISIPQNYETAISLFELAAEMNSAKSNYHLGMMYEHGKGVKINRIIAIKYFQKSADLGSGDANYILGIFSLKDNNTKLAYDYFLKSADLGNANSQYNVAVALYEGNVVWEKNLPMAFGYAKAAHDSNPGDLEIERFMNKIYQELMSEN